MRDENQHCVLCSVSRQLTMLVVITVRSRVSNVWYLAIDDSQAFTMSGSTGMPSRRMLMVYGDFAAVVPRLPSSLRLA